jgi:uncharacterized protein YjbI with pentapeptide repeats
MHLRICFLMMFSAQVGAFDAGDMSKLNAGRECARCDLSQADLSDAALSGVDLNGPA